MTMHVRAHALRAAAPRALLGAIRAYGGDVGTVLSELNKSVTGLKNEFQGQFDGLQKIVNDFRAANETALKGKADVVLTQQVDRVNAAIDEQKDKIAETQTKIEAFSKEIGKINDRLAAAVVTGGGQKVDPRTASPDFPSYVKAFDGYFRHGEDSAGGAHALRQLELKALGTVGSNPDGGYTVLPEIEQSIDETLKEVSPMRELASSITIGTGEYKKLVNVHGTASGWVGETGSRPSTAGAQLVDLRYPVMELYAMPGASQTLLDDSFVDIGAWLAGEVQLEFAQQEGVAFITGDGQNKPNGFIGGYQQVADTNYAWGKIGYVPSGAAGAFLTTDNPPKPADAVIDLYHALKTAYRRNCSFLANRKTLGAIRKLKDGQGNYLLNAVLRPEGFIEEILSRPAVEMPDMPDIAANIFSLAVGDWKRAYLIVDRIGIRVLRDAYTSKPYVLFYTTKRVGGGVQNFEALKLMKFAVS